MRTWLDSAIYEGRRIIASQVPDHRHAFRILLLHGFRIGPARAGFFVADQRSKAA